MGERSIEVNGKTCRIMAARVESKADAEQAAVTGWTVNIVYSEDIPHDAGTLTSYDAMLFETEDEALAQGEVIARSKARGSKGLRG